MSAAGPKGAGAGLGPMPWLKWKTKDRAKRFERLCTEYMRIPHGFGAGQPMKIYPPQRALRRGIRDHDVTVEVVGKGNTKSSTAAALGIECIVDPLPGDHNPLVAIVSGSKEQAAQGVFNTACQIIRASPVLEACTIIYDGQETRRIECPATGGVMRPFAPTPRRLHGIIPSLGLVDEIGLIPDDKVWETMVQSIGKRPGAKVFGFGTPGWERNALWRLRQQWLKGELEGEVFWIEWAAKENCEIDDYREWKRANPMRAAMDPDGWLKTLKTIRTTLANDDKFRIFHLAQWPDVVGTKLVSAERWAGLAADPLEEDPPMRFVTIEGDYSRKNLAVIGVDVYDGIMHLTVEGIWEHQTEPVDVETIVAAVMNLGEPTKVLIRSHGQLDDVAYELELEGVPVERVQSHNAAWMREPTDKWLEVITEGLLTHDNAPALLEQLKGTRLEPRREGPTIARDERDATEEAARIDASIAAVIAVWQARTVPIPAVY